MELHTWLATQSLDGISLKQFQSVLELAAEGATVPFMARYRKEKTNNLDETQIQRILDLQEQWIELEKRRQFVITEISSQGKMTPELEQQLTQTPNIHRVEELYAPFKQKRKTKAMLAREHGLEPLAMKLWELRHQQVNLDEHAISFVKPAQTEDPKIPSTVPLVLEGVQHLFIEKITLMEGLRQRMKEHLEKQAFLRVTKAEKAKQPSKFEMYFDYWESLSSLKNPQTSHRYLAIKRGCQEEELQISLQIKNPNTAEGIEVATSAIPMAESVVCPKTPSGPWQKFLQKCCHLAVKVYLIPSLENDLHRELKTIADDAAIGVFAQNLRKLLLASPLGPRTVLGIDPGIRTGCKMAIVDKTGKYLGSDVIFPDLKPDQATTLIRKAIEHFNVEAIAVGNGTAGRETETFLRKALEDRKHIPIVMVSESGASVYSASALAREEFPDLDLTVRGAISIARRLQDPLSELVKVDPQSIGVGQYQHDVSANELKKNLANTVTSCVNNVGVNVNTASAHLLSYVAGIGPSLAKAIVEYRAKQGLFTSREDLLKAPRFTPKVFEQAAGFLRVPESTNILDNTGVHPEQYSVLSKWATTLGRDLKDLIGSGAKSLMNQKQLAAEVGAYTLADIAAELEKPGRDPRDPFKIFQYRADIMKLEDVKPGMLCPGIVTNVTNFGAFVDIGVHQDGLVHISQLSDSFVKDPREVVSPGDHVQARVVEVNLAKKQIALSLKKERDTTAGAYSPRNSGNGSRPGAAAPAPAARTTISSKSPGEQFQHSPFGTLIKK